MRPKIKSKSISKLITQAMEVLDSENYSPRTQEPYRRTWKQFQDFCNAKGYKLFHPAQVEEFLEWLTSETPSLKPSTMALRAHHISRLKVLFQGDSWDKGDVGVPEKMLEEFKEFLVRLIESQKHLGYAEATYESRRKVAFHAIMHFQKLGVSQLQDINRAHIASYVLSLKGHAASTIHGELSNLRVMLRTLYIMEYTENDLSVYVPQYNVGAPQSLVKIWNSEEINSVLETVDLSSPKGKRDAAMITIAAELGVRSKDICDLKLLDIDWEACTIRFVQSKTKKPNVLPLSEKVGSAIISYLQVRPQTGCENVFVRFIPPYDKMKSFATAFGRYVSRSGVTIPKDAHHGVHSLRASVATKMLAADVSPDVIYPILGHADRETLNHYLRLDIENLRKCALSFEGGEFI